MNRRQFFKTSAPLGLFPVMANLPIKGIAATSPLAFNPCHVTDRSMVIIFLSGGNDIINTTVPLDQLDDYVYARPNIHLPQNSLIDLDTTLPSERQIGLHPSLTDFKAMYDEGMLNIVQRVGYAQPNKSHFKSLDNWLTGSGGALPDRETGWIGRFLSDRYPGYSGSPFLGEPDPLGILLGNMNATGFHTFDEHKMEINLSGQDPAGFYTLISSLGGAPIPNIPNSEHGEMLMHLAAIDESVNVYAERISQTFSNGNNSSVNYPGSNLGDQLKTIARMLDGGSRTKIFMANTGGFDTHGGQVDPADTTQGRHANLLGGVGSAVKAFQDDLKNMGLDQNVVTVIFSEFGRKIIQNGSYGCDHGTLNSMFVVGKGVEAGVHGTNIDLTNLDNPGAAHPDQLEYDYRVVFASLLQDWLGANDTSLANTFLSSQYIGPKIPLINASNIVPSSCYLTPTPPPVCACMQVKVVLQGFYDTAQQSMRTQLADSGALPLAQPYNNSPFNYTGTEAATAFPADTVDWLLLELRDADEPDQVIAQKAVLLRKDGIVMAPDGTPGVAFDGVTEGFYRLAVFHRNHLGVLSSDTVLLDAPNFIYDFTTGEMKAEGEGQQTMVGTMWAMIAGDTDKNQLVNNEDFNFWDQNVGQTGYHQADLNADGIVDTQDYDLWSGNRSKLGNFK